MLDFDNQYEDEDFTENDDILDHSFFSQLNNLENEDLPVVAPPEDDYFRRITDL